ncbi:MAG: hypothetical protein ABGY42_05695, partial [bacterium]
MGSSDDKAALDVAPAVFWVSTAIIVSVVLLSVVATDAVDGFLVAPKTPLATELVQSLFLLTGHGDDSQWPVVRFLPIAMKEVLEHCAAL